MSPPLTKEEVTAITGRNAEYYWLRWTPLIQGQSWTSFNWAAFFLTGVWLSYRKMYGLAVVFYGILTLGLLADQLHPVNKETFGHTFGWIIALICGAGGNRWYWSHARSLAEEVRAQNGGGIESNQLLSRHGGTSISSGIGSLIVFFVIGIAIVRWVR
jgi:hypothetical protein